MARVVALSTLITITVVAIPLCAFATPVHSTYGGWDSCRGIDPANQALLSDDGGGHLQVSSTANVVCPILKKTSGPGIWSGDNISAARIYFKPGSYADCHLMIYSANKYGTDASYPYSSIMEEDDDSSVNGSSVNLTSSTEAYWYGYEAHDTWYYPELFCTISSGSLKSYYVDENGTDQTGYRIASMASCQNTNSYGYRHDPGIAPWNDPFTTGQPGGFIIAQTPETDFNVDCPPLDMGGDAVEVAVGSTTTPQDPQNPPTLMGCETTDTNTWQYAPYTTQQFLPETLSFTQTTPSDLICAMQNNPSLGDAKVFSYRTALDVGDFSHCCD